MGFEAFQDPNSQFPIPLSIPYNGPSSSHNSPDMPQPNGNLAYNVFTASFSGRSSFPRDMEQGSFYNTSMDSYMSLHSNAMSFSGNNPMTEIQQSESTEGEGSKRSRKGKSKKDPSRSTPSPKKSRVNAISRENVPKQEIMEKIMMKEFEERNLQMIAMAEKYGVQNQLHRPILCSDPHHLRGFNMQQLPKSVLQEQSNLKMACAPVLDASICARRLKQYLFHMRNNTSDNGIIYWKEFVSEYYAPGSRKRWCFCKYENFQVQSAGVFYPKSMEVWSCDICGSRSGKGLEAKYDIFPRLLMTKFDSGMRDEIMFLESPCSRDVSCGLLLQYGKATVESVYENYRVVHEGRLRIVFRYDLKIMSWEFCAHNHEEFLLRSLVTPQVNQLVRVSKVFLSDEFSRASSEDMHTLCDMFALAGGQLARNMETPLVNDLGYPKRFIRCLQIAEVADSMKDIMALSLQANMGPIDCWRMISSRNHQMKGKQQREMFAGLQSPPTGLLGPRYHASLRQMSENSTVSGSRSSGQSFIHPNPSAASMRQNVQDASFNFKDHSSRSHGGDPDQALVDKLLHGIVSAGMGTGTRNEMRRGESSVSASVQSNSVTGARSDFSKAGSRGDSSVGRSVTVKEEQCSPERVPEAYKGSAFGFVKSERE